MRTCLFTLSFLLLAASLAPADEQLTEALKRHRLRIHQLELSLQAARQKHQQGVRESLSELRNEFEAAIQRAQNANQRKLARRLRLEMESQLDPQTPHVPQLAGRPVYECVLGMYGQAIRGFRYPLINLKPPYEAELWSAEVQSAAAGIASFEGIDYIGTALLLVPRSDSYTVHIPERGTRLAINGMVVSAGSIQLKKGIYHIEIYSGTWGQPHIIAARAEIVESESGQRLPFVNTLEALQRFRSQTPRGVELSEATAYRPVELDIDTRLPPSRISPFRPQKPQSLQRILDLEQFRLPTERETPLVPDVPNSPSSRSRR